MKSRSNTAVILLPLLGVCIFIGLYFIAAALYPGGSEVDRSAKGFSWMNNYWCDLLENYAENGEPNRAKKTAIIGMSVLCLSIILFWFFVPHLFPFGSFWKNLIRYTGLSSMAMLVFLQADYHDTVINTAVILGLIAMTVTLVGLYRIRLYTLFLLGVICLLLSLLNNYIYYTKNWIGYLAIIQKISFFLFLLWFCLVNLHLVRKKAEHPNQPS